MFAEHERIKMLENVEKQMDKDPSFAYDQRYLKNGQKFNIFDDIFSSDLKAELLKVDNLKETFDNPGSTELKLKVKQSIDDYFQKQSDSVEAKFNEAPFISGSLVSSMQSKFAKAKMNLRGDAAKAAMKSMLIKSMVANMWIHNVETINMFYGDLAMYNHAKQEFHKRNAGIGSTGTVFRTDDSMLRYINNRVKRGYADRLGITYDNYDGRINTAIIEDINSKSVFYNEIASSQKEAFTEQFKSAYPKETAAQIEARVNEKLFGKKGTQEDPGKDGIMHAFANMNEADAQGYLTFDMYRILQISQGEWNFDTQEKAYQEIIKNNGKGVDQTQLAELFPPAKYQYWGALQTTGVPPVMAFHKYSLMPLIPGVYKEGSNIDKLHKKMMQEGVDYVTYQSGSKIGTLTKKAGPDKWYNSNNRSVNTDITFTKNTIFANFLKNQLKIHKHFKGTVTFPTQLRKLIEDGLMEFGVPTDFRASLSIEDRIAQWAGLSEAEKLNPANSKFYSLVKVYEDNIAALTELKKKKLLEQAGLTEKDGQITGNQEKLWNFVKNELTRQDLADHEIDFIQVVNGKLVRDLSMSLSADKIEKLLNALVTRRLIKQKFHGEGLFQLSSAMFENPESTTRFTNPTQEDLDKWGTNDLPFYRIRDGKVQAAKVKVALHGDFEYLLYLKDKEGNQIAVKDAEGNLDYDASLDKLNSLIKDDAWLDADNHREMITMVGVRIPTQGLNSMEFMEVYEFLPKSASNVIILPAEIVAKSGADFDIDKLTVLMPNISKSYKTEISNANLRMLQNQYPELDFSRDNVNMVLDAAKNDNEVYTLTPEDTQILKALEQFVQVEASYKTNKSEKGLENNIITNIKDILQLPENYSSLTRPNGIDILDPIQADLADQVGGYNPSFTYQADNQVKKGSISPTRALEIEYNLYKHYTNNIGKQTLGLGAVDNTFNTLLNRVNAYLEPIFNGQPQTLYLPHNTLSVKGQKAISLASRMDAKGEYRISDIINQMINGWVDIAKDAWIFNIQGNKEIAPSLLFMVQAGVPIEQAIYMASIPSVREYVRQQKLNKSTFSEPLGYGNERTYAKSNASKAILEKLGFVIPEDMSVVDFVNSQLSSAMAQSQFDGEFELNKLKEIVKGNKKPSAQTDAYEKMAFLHFLQIEEMAKAVRDVKLSMNLDTAESKSLFEASNRKKLIAELKQNGRISSDLVDKLLSESPISSFAIQDFQLAIWKDAFELRNHPMLNKFVSDMLTPDNVKNTLGDNEKVAAALKNDILSYIFQNSFNTASLTVDGLDSIKAYRGYDVALMENAPVEVRENSEKLRMGAAMFNGVMYIDKNRIIQDFVEKSYVKGAAGYSSLLLAPVNEKAFTTIDEYTKFVLEREYLRGTLDFDAVKESKEFKELQTVAREKGWYPMRDRESSADYKSRVTRNLLEMTLRDKALDNSFNNWKLFQSTDTFAHQFARFKDDYPSLTENFPLLKYLVINKNDQGYTNIKLVDTKLDANTINRMHQMFLRLTDPSSLGIDNAKEAQAVANFFRKFPVVGFLQSGLNTRGQFALGRILPEEILTGLMEKPVKDFVNHLNSFVTSKGETVGTPLILLDYGKKFLQENSNKKFSTMFRGKNYKSDIKLQNSIDFGNKPLAAGIAYINDLKSVKLTPSQKAIVDQNTSQVVKREELNQKRTLPSNLKDYVNSLIPGWADNPNNQARLFAEFVWEKEFLRLEDDYTFRTKFGEYAEDSIKEYKEKGWIDDPKYKQDVAGFVVDVISAKLAKEGISLEDMFNNIFGLTQPISQPANQLTKTKEGVQKVFEDNPELATIGNAQEYSEYLDSVFPNSKVKDILYRGSENPNKLEASDLDPEKGTGARNLGKGIYLAKDKALADKYSGKAGRTNAFIVNVPNFQIISLQKNWDRGYWSADNVTVRDITNNTSDTLINFEGLDKDNYVEFNKYTGKYVGPLNENGFPAYQKENMSYPEWTQLAVNSNKQILVLGSKQDVEGFKKYLADKKATSEMAPLSSYVSVEDLQKNPTFEGMAVEFVKEISTNKDKKVAARSVKGENKVLLVADVLFEKYNEKAWTEPATQKDGSKATALDPNAFSNFNEFLTFVMLHEKAHTYLFKNESETTGQYEDRINDEAMRRLNQIGNKEVQTANAAVQDMVTITDQMVQDFMFNVCK